MKEIKFRAWNKLDKKMLIPTGHISFCPISEDWIVKATTYQDSDSGKWKTDLEELYGLIPMQFTGLKDKNGKEVFEGDILNNFVEDSTISINWDKSGACWNFSEHNIFLDDGHGRGDWHFTTGYAKNCEIIGNIYENPELFK